VIAAGLDVGSRTIVLATLDGDILDSAILPTGVVPLRRCQELLADRAYDHLIVTGYGRHLVGPSVGGEAVSEIRAYAVGAKHLYPDCGTIIDVGGQDSKVTLLAPTGAVQKFEMNDRCAAGTGKFLEIMANTLEVGLEDLAGLALSATSAAQINSLCTVFAESEVVSLIAKGEPASSIALGLHEAIAGRIANMARRVGAKDRVVFAGGGALNRALHKLLSLKLGKEISVPENPQIVGALGAALLAGQMTTSEAPETALTSV
jgi:(R)-2-hydroxyacyl-CoA dehydratese activating ATPase